MIEVEIMLCKLVEVLPVIAATTEARHSSLRANIMILDKDAMHPHAMNQKKILTPTSLVHSDGSIQDVFTRPVGQHYAR